LLLPKELFVPRLERNDPSIQLIEDVAEEFKTSRLATAVQYIQYTNEVVALVVSRGWEIEWSKRAKDFRPIIKAGQIHKDSAAGERLLGIGRDTKRMVLTPAYAWLKDAESSHRDIKESSIYLEYYDRTVTLLWWDEDE